MKQPLLLFFFLSVLCSCTGSEEFLSKKADSLCSISFSPVTIGSVSTRASTTTYPPQSTGVEVAANLADNGTTIAKQYTVSDGAGTLTPSDGKDLTLWGGYYYTFYQYSPVIGFDNGTTNSLSIPQLTDFLLDSLSTKIDVASGQSVDLPSLDHRCSMLVFKTQCDASNTLVTSISVGSGGLSLAGLTHSPQSYVLGSGFTGLASAAQDGTVTIGQSSFDGSDNVYFNSIAVLPKAIGSVGLTMDCVINGNNYTITATIPSMTFESGVKYTFTLDFKDASINLNLTTANWNAIINDEGSTGKGSSTVTVGTWAISTVNAGDMGDGSSTITVGAWTVVAGDTGNMGGFGATTVGNWNTIGNTGNIGGN